jgi:hypothetical protein
MLGTNTFSQVKSIYRAATSNNATDLCADIMVSTSNTAAIQGLQDAALLYSTGNEFTKTIRAVGAPSTTDMIFNFNRSEIVEIQPSGIFNAIIPPGDGTETFPYGASALSGSSKRDLRLVFSKLSTGSSNLRWQIATATNGSGTTTLTGNVASHFDYLNVGDKLEFAGNNMTYYVTSISSATSLTVDRNLPAISSNAVYKVYKAGDVIDLTTKGASDGTVRTVTGAANNSLLQFNLMRTMHQLLVQTPSMLR